MSSFRQRARLLPLEGYPAAQTDELCSSSCRRRGRNSTQPMPLSAAANLRA